MFGLFPSPRPEAYRPSASWFLRERSFQWERLVQTCTRCGASWNAPRDEPHKCSVDALLAAQRKQTIAALEQLRANAPADDVRYQQAITDALVAARQTSAAE